MSDLHGALYKYAYRKNYFCKIWHLLQNVMKAVAYYMKNNYTGFVVMLRTIILLRKEMGGKLC